MTTTTVYQTGLRVRDAAEYGSLWAALSHFRRECQQLLDDPNTPGIFLEQMRVEVRNCTTLLERLEGKRPNVPASDGTWED